MQSKRRAAARMGHSCGPEVVGGLRAAGTHMGTGDDCAERGGLDDDGLSDVTRS